MGHADYLKLGDTNAICDTCGFKYKISELSKQWDGLMTCKDCWDYRHPQEYIRGIPDTGNPPANPRPEAADQYENLTATTTPAVPASGTPQANSLSKNVIVQVYGGTVSAIFVGSVNMDQTSGIFTLLPGQTITIKYTIVPTWIWQEYS